MKPQGAFPVRLPTAPNRTPMGDIKVPTAECFRAQSTGVGQTRAMSERTGLIRSQKVIDEAPAKQRAHAVGYPRTTEETWAAMMQPPGPAGDKAAKKR